MGKQKISAYIIVAVSMAASAQSYAAAPVVYGEDNRKDLYEVRNPLHAKLADSTVALVRSTSMLKMGANYSIQARTLQQSLGVCSTERFAQQQNGAFCSGFLVAKNIVLTAGHCVSDQMECSSIKMVFGYAIKQAGVNPSSAPQGEVYSCKRLVHREQIGSGADFAIIELDRPVLNHDPLPLNRDRMRSTIERGTKLVLIGNPSGLPTKVADGASVRDGNRPNYFVANTDSYQGNSGSAVFNSNNGEVEGILVRGEKDFEVTMNGCAVTKVCTEDSCRGEDVTKISAVIPYLPAQSMGTRLTSR